MRTRTTQLYRLIAVIAGLAVLVPVAAGCGSAHSTAAPAAAQQSAAGAEAVRVSERDFHIAAPVTLHAGEVQFTVDNEGPERHEFIVAHVGGSALPLRADGLTIDEEALQKDEVGELEPGEPGAVRTLRLKLTPGRYVFFCNMAGHYLGGMRHEVVVQ